MVWPYCVGPAEAGYGFTTIRRRFGARKLTPVPNRHQTTYYLDMLTEKWTDAHVALGLALRDLARLIPFYT